MATYTYTLYPTKNAMISRKNPSTHYAPGTSLKAAWKAAAYSQSGVYEIENHVIMHFDLPNDIVGKIISSVYVYIYVSSANFSNSGVSATIGLSAKETDWSEPGVTWDSFYTGNLNPINAYAFDINGIGGYINRRCDNYSNSRKFIDVVLASPNPGASTLDVSSDVTVQSRTGANRPYIVITASDSTPTCKPVSPANTFVKSSAINRFTWEFDNAVGGVQQQYQLQYSTDNSTWTTLASVMSTNTYHDVPVGTFPAGTIYWRVRVASEYGIYSAWSESAKFVSIAAPNAPQITTATNTPRPYIAWTSEGQQSYQVKIGDDIDSGTLYGVTREYKCPAYLSDGYYRAKVRVQNSYGLWSEWGSAYIDVANTAGSAITLKVGSDHRARLTWTDVSKKCIVYRDDAPIAVVNAGVTEYVDQMAMGSHKYQVRAVLDDGNYTLSNTCRVLLVSKFAVISALDNIDWLTVAINSSPSITVTPSVVYQHYAGMVDPAAETSGFVDTTYQFSAILLDRKLQAAFEALVGKTVIAKFPTGERVVGVLGRYSKMSYKQAGVYGYAIQQTHYDDEVTI